MSKRIPNLDYLVGAVALFAFALLLAELSSYFDAYAAVFSVANLIIFSMFSAEAIYKLLASADKAGHLRAHWFDGIVVIPLLQFIPGTAETAFFIIIRQIAIVFMLVSRAKKANRFITLLSLKPAQLMVSSFLFAIASGTILLMLPIATQTGIKTSLVDALFTATSATCVTGLLVQDTATHFSIFGQLVILGLIQIGGLGIMTFSVAMALLLKKRLKTQRQIIMRDVLDNDTGAGVEQLVKFIVLMTLTVELCGALLLFLTWKDMFSSRWLAGYHAVFHAISAFCNAGFSTFSDNLMGFSRDISTSLTIGLLIIFGGLGFSVIKDLTDHAAERLSGRSKTITPLRVQTKIVLVTSLMLIVGGAALFYLFEARTTLQDLDLPEKILICFFQSVAARTAGFNTVDFAGLSHATLFLVMVLMVIGGSPGSTAGGIKTTTVSLLTVTLLNNYKQRPAVELCKRTIPADTIQKAISVLMLSLLIILVFTLAILHSEKKPFAALCFEVTSAFGTAGLSTGITPQLSTRGKLLLSLLMFIGRLGPITIGYALTRFRAPAKYTYVEERPMVG